MKMKSVRDRMDSKILERAAWFSTYHASSVTTAEFSAPKSMEHEDIAPASWRPGNRSNLRDDPISRAFHFIAEVSVLPRSPRQFYVSTYILKKLEVLSAPVAVSRKVTTSKQKAKYPKI